MRKILTTFVLLILTIIFLVGSAEAWANGEDHGRSEEIWQKLSAGKLKCEEISAEQFEALGDFFMERMVGPSHEVMDKQMEQMMGKEGLEQMHLVMGKRMSGCDPNVSMPGMGGGMMGMMMSMGYPNFVQRGGEGAMMGSGMMGWGWNQAMGPGWLWLGGVFWLVTWILVIAVLVALLRWLWKKGNK